MREVVSKRIIKIHEENFQIIELELLNLHKVNQSKIGESDFTICFNSKNIH